VRAVTGLGKTLGMKTTAEGVETREQLDWLRSEGCTEVQGYLFSRPQRAEALAILISDIDQKLAA
jgi:EAL domain-containing protein (putative c-di-GMP-specific phosphodiesterase class I)